MDSGLIAETTKKLILQSGVYMAGNRHTGHDKGTSGPPVLLMYVVKENDCQAKQHPGVRGTSEGISRLALGGHASLMKYMLCSEEAYM